MVNEYCVYTMAAFCKALGIDGETWRSWLNNSSFGFRHIVRYTGRNRTGRAFIYGRDFIRLLSEGDDECPDGSE